MSLPTALTPRNRQNYFNTIPTRSNPSRVMLSIMRGHFGRFRDPRLLQSILESRPIYDEFVNKGPSVILLTLRLGCRLLGQERPVHFDPEVDPRAKLIMETRDRL